MYAFIGDIHSQLNPLEQALGYCYSNQRIPILLGDLFDSRIDSSDSAGVYRLVRQAEKEMGAITLRSNHQNKLERFIAGSKVQLTEGIQQTLNDFEQGGVALQEVYEWLNTFPYGLVLRDSENVEYRCAHAMFPSQILIPPYESMYKVMEVTRTSRDYMLYGPRKRASSEGLPARVEWWREYSDRDWVRVAGHYHIVHIAEDNLVLDGNMGGSSEGFEEESRALRRGVDNLCLWDVELKKLVQFSE